MHLKKGWSVLKGTFSEFSEDNVLRLSAALAYYSIFSIGPLLIIAVGVAGLAFGHSAVRQQVQQQAQSMMGDNAAKMLDSMMAAQNQHGNSLAATIVGIVVLLFGASGVFGQLQDALNTIWEVTSKPGAGIWKFIRSRFLSFGMVLVIGFLLLVSMALTTFLTAAGGAVGSRFGFSEGLAHAVNFIVSFAVITLLFALIFKYLPDVKVPFSKVWMGAIVTALLFTAGKYMLALYLGRQGTTSSYGAAGSVVLILMWIYYASVILLFGAEFTQVYARQTGARVVPAKYAVPMTEEQRAQQGMPSNSEKKNQGASPETPAPGRPAPERPAPERTVPAYQPPRVRPAFQALTPVSGQEPRWGLLGVVLAAGFAAGMWLFRRPPTVPVKG